MTTLDRVMEMQQQNKSDAEITAQLQNEGIAPTEINDSLNQAKVKNAIAPQEKKTVPEGMQPSITSTQQSINQEAPSPQPIQNQETPQQYSQEMPLAPQSTPQQEYYKPSPQPPAPQQEYYQPSPQPPAPQQEYYQPTPQSYPEQDYYTPQESLSTETISEIAEQITTEKLEDYKNKIGDIASFKTQTQDKVNDIDDRLKRIENSIDKLQQAVLGKIGEFGESSAMIHKDLDNLHGTVAKLMNPLIDNVNEMKKLSK